MALFEVAVKGKTIVEVRRNQLTKYSCKFWFCVKFTLNLNAPSLNTNSSVKNTVKIMLRMSRKAV